MARYSQSVCRICRREGIKLFLKGDRCLSSKCALTQRGYAPGEHGKAPKKLSEYGRQLREKQKLRKIYGLLEKQFKKYFLEADKKKGITGENLLLLLERRLDNTVYRLGLASSRRLARQLIRHRHFLVNSKNVDIPSFRVSPGDIIEVKEKSKNIPSILESLKTLEQKVIPSWLEFSSAELKGKVLSVPLREEIEHNIKEQLIVEFYSR